MEDRENVIKLLDNQAKEGMSKQKKVNERIAQIDHLQQGWTVAAC